MGGCKVVIPLVWIRGSERQTAGEDEEDDEIKKIPSGAETDVLQPSQSSDQTLVLQEPVSHSFCLLHVNNRTMSGPVLSYQEVCLFFTNKG